MSQVSKLFEQIEWFVTLNQIVARVRKLIRLRQQYDKWCHLKDG